jgi:predicted lipoprotein with Yx(FWY)xxD motif
MPKTKYLCCTMLMAAALLLCVSSEARAEWPEDGNPICTYTEDQKSVAITSDGAGGAIMAWQDERTTPGPSILAQRVDGFGNTLWDEDGLPVCPIHAGYQYGPAIASDGEGGALIAWMDDSAGDYDVWAQRMDATGGPEWGLGCVLVCAATGDQQAPAVISDGAGGAFIVWEDDRTGELDIYAQRVNAEGVPQWLEDGVPICTIEDDQSNLDVVSDGAGGAIITWHDLRFTYEDVFAQRVDGAGNVLWGANGVEVHVHNGSHQTYPALVSDGAGGAIIAWTDNRFPTPRGFDVCAQRLDDEGVMLWGPDGVLLCGADYEQRYPAVVSDGAGGAVVTWSDHRNGVYEIFAQRVDTDGVPQWAADGVALSTAGNNQYDQAVVSDGAGGAVVTWFAWTGGWRVFAQRIDAGGTILWDPQAVSLCTSPGNQEYPKIASDGDGGAIVAWRDYRSLAHYDIYAQRVTRQGFWGLPAAAITSVQDVPEDQGGHVRMTFDASRLDVLPDSLINHYKVWRDTLQEGTFAIGNHGIDQAGPAPTGHESVGGVCFSAGGGWELIGTVDAEQLPQYVFTAETLSDSTSADPAMESYYVSAHARESSDFWDSEPDSGYSVDNLAPDEPVGPVGDFLAGAELWLHWNPNNEADLSHYAIYRGATPDFVPSQGNRLGTTTDTSYVDDDPWGENYYKLSAWDVHENESDYALLTPDEITGVPGTERPYGNALFQNVPNPFVASTRIVFSMETEGRVTLRVFDAKGRLVRVLADELREPRRYMETWNGKDANGRPVAAGTYFYRLDAPGWSEVKKMTLAK